MNKKTFSFFAILGMAIAIGTAAFTAPKEKRIDLISFGYDNNNPTAPVWVSLDAIPDYECLGNEGICTGEFREDQLDPVTSLPKANEQPKSITHGSFKEK